MAINYKNVKKLRDQLEGEKLAKRGLGFNMSPIIDRHPEYVDHTGYKCGTVACLAGSAFAVIHPRFSLDRLLLADCWTSRRNVYGEAADWLGLNGNQADILFSAAPVPGGDFPDLESISLEDAIKALDYIIKRRRVSGCWDHLG